MRIILKVLSSLILVACLFWSIESKAQNVVTDSTATTVPYWEKGDNQVLNLTKTIKKFKKGKLKDTYKARYKVNVMVLEESDSHYIIEWRYSNVQVTGKGVQLKIMDDLYNGLRIEYQTDEVGTFKGITNYEEVVKRLDHSSDSVVEIYKDEHEVITTVAAQIKELLRTKHGVETITLRDVAIYHGVLGYEFKLNEQLLYDSYFPNAFGGEDFPVLGKSEMVELDQEGMRCVVVISEDMDKKEGARIFNAQMKKLSAQMGIDPLKDEEFPTYNVSDETTYDVDLKTGWLNLTYRRRVITDDTKRVEQMRMRLM